MSHICFRPWIGKNYLTEGYKGKRVLVLGESHYCPQELSQNGRCYPICKKELMNEVCFSQTEVAISEFITDYVGRGDQQTYLCFERAMTGKILTLVEREEFWNSIMFYNYIQFCQSGPRKPLPSEYWADSEKAFQEILEKYAPDYIVVWGSRLYKGMPEWNCKYSILKLSEDDWTEVRVYHINNKLIPAMRVYHPSTQIGKSWSYWHQFYELFFSKY